MKTMNRKINNKKSKQDSKPKPTEEVDDQMNIINSKCPEKYPYIRKVHPIWKGFYRVNYHNPDEGNYVIKSYFININN